MTFRSVRLIVLAAALAAVPLGLGFAQGPASPGGGGEQRTVWYFYTVKWGHQDEFLDLFQRNHYPVLREQVKRGRLTTIRTFVPTYHGDGRADWTFAVALTYRDAATMSGPSGEEEIVRQLYPDQQKFRAEERRRFELLVAHWDVPLSEIDFETRQVSR